MNADLRKAHAAFHDAIAKAFPAYNFDARYDFCDRLTKMTTTAQRYAVTACNRELEEFEVKRQATATRQIRALCEKWGLAVKVGGGPRGYIVHLHLPTKQHNTLGGAEAGYGVPPSRKDF